MEFRSGSVRRSDSQVVTLTQTKEIRRCIIWSVQLVELKKFRATKESQECAHSHNHTAHAHQKQVYLKKKHPQLTATVRKINKSKEASALDLSFHTLA